jgi:hypothetical protein
MYANWTLLFVSQIGGILLICATMVLVGFRRIYFDAETKEPISFDLPIFGKIRSQTPAVVVILVAAVMVMYPIVRAPDDQAVLKGSVQTTGQTVTVAVVPVPKYQETFQASEPFSLPLPLIRDASYQVEYIVDKQIVGEQEASLEGHRFKELKPFVWSPPPGNIVPRPIVEISDAKLRQLGIIR